MFARMIPAVVVAAIILLFLLQVVGCLDLYLHAAPQRSPPLRLPPDVNEEHDVQ